MTDSVIKIHIFFEFKDGPFGGGNQFLKALKKSFEEKGVYSDNPENADVILFNSHHKLVQLLKFKNKHPEKIMIHRIDGPVFLIRSKNLEIDRLIYKINNQLADATIYQSDWSKKKNYELGIKKNYFETTIINAPDTTIFNRLNKHPFKFTGKIKIIASSWASNKNKGFKIYEWLDDNLDFSKYEMTFCGNSPLTFKNIKHIKPVQSTELAKILKEHDIYITASQKDPCSNSLIEALHCGLPAIALNDGGHPEIIGKGGLTFNKQEEIPEILNKIVENYTKYQNNISLPNINTVADKYHQFMKSVFEKSLNKEYNIKKLNLIRKLSFYTSYYKSKLIKLKLKFINK